MDNPNKTLVEYLEEINKTLGARNKVKNGTAESREDIVSPNLALKLFRNGIPSGLASHVSSMDKGYTFYIKEAGLTFFIRRKKVSLPWSWRNNSDTLYAYKIELKEDTGNVGNMPLMDIMDLAIKNAELERQKKEAIRTAKLDTFKGLMDKHGLGFKDFEALNKAFSTLEYKHKRKLEEEA